MSQQYPGGFITRANVDPTSSFPASPAPGVWTLDQALQYRQAGVWPSPALNAIEDVFSAWLYTGNSSTQTITNGINLSGQGGLVWIKDRTNLADHRLIDTVTGAQKELISNQTTAQVARTTGLTAFNNDGFSLGSASGYNTTATNYVSWAFREQSKFFDVVTYTGNGSNRTIAHNLGSVPGTIIIKRTDTTGAWAVYHRSLANTEYLVLNTTAAKATGATYWNSTTPTSTVFSLGTAVDVNANAGTYVAYLFAHDAGGFGPNNTDNVISCGSFVSDASGNATVTLGYEPQWVMTKRSDLTGVWSMFDTMRGMPLVGSNQLVEAQSNAAETAGGQALKPTSTGFSVTGTNASATFVYIAIRRGPMKAPTTGTSVYQVYAAADTTTQTVGFPTDMFFDAARAGNALNTVVMTRLQGPTVALNTSATSAENGSAGNIGAAFQSNTTFRPGIGFNWWCSFRRAPGFFDVVCYTGTGSGSQTISHNLGVVPELTINKSRSLRGWTVYYNNSRFLRLNDVTAGANESLLNPTATTFVANAAAGFGMNAAENYVTYLFATLPGVSKVGMYTGTGALQTINCGFTSGARFVLIKRNDSTGDWWVYDSARGITSGNDPYFFLNSSVAEVTGTNYVDTTSVGFQVTAAAPAGLNANGGTYIFLAIA